MTRTDPSPMSHAGREDHSLTSAALRGDASTQKWHSHLPKPPCSTSDAGQREKVVLGCLYYGRRISNTNNHVPFTSFRIERTSGVSAPECGVAGGGDGCHAGRPASTWDLRSAGRSYNGREWCIPALSSLRRRVWRHAPLGLSAMYTDPVAAPFGLLGVHVDVDPALGGHHTPTHSNPTAGILTDGAADRGHRRGHGHPRLVQARLPALQQEKAKPRALAEIVALEAEAASNTRLLLLLLLPRHRPGPWFSKPGMVFVGGLLGGSKTRNGDFEEQSESYRRVSVRSPFAAPSFV